MDEKWHVPTWTGVIHTICEKLTSYTWYINTTSWYTSKTLNKSNSGFNYLDTVQRWLHCFYYFLLRYDIQVRISIKRWQNDDAQIFQEQWYVNNNSSYKSTYMSLIYEIVFKVRNIWASQQICVFITS